MEDKNEGKVFVLLSGGIDSSVCLQIALDKYSDVSGVHFDYGQQTNSIERDNVEKQAEKNNIELYIIDYRDVFRNFAEGTIKNKEYSRDKVVEEDHSVGYVPQRNLHFLTSAAAIAEKKHTNK